LIFLKEKLLQIEQKLKVKIEDLGATRLGSLVFVLNFETKQILVGAKRKMKVYKFKIPVWKFLGRI